MFSFLCICSLILTSDGRPSSFWLPRGCNSYIIPGKYPRRIYSSYACADSELTAIFNKSPWGMWDRSRCSTD